MSKPTTTLLKLPTSPLALFKVSTESVAAGKALPKSAKAWDGVYVPTLQIIVSAEALPCGAVPWKQAAAAAAAATVCGIRAQRALTRLEYAVLFQDDLYAPALDKKYFRDAGEHYWEWTSTQCAPADDAWFVYLDDGSAYRYHQSFHGHVRAVCAGQCLDLGK